MLIPGAAIAAGLFEVGGQLLHDFGMQLGEVSGFAGVFDQVVESVNFLILTVD